MCQNGWTLFQGMCYIAGNDTSYDYLTWQEAEKKCQRIGNNGHLVSIHSQSEQDFLQFLRKYVFFLINLQIIIYSSAITY